MSHLNLMEFEKEVLSICESERQTAVAVQLALF